MNILEGIFETGEIILCRTRMRRGGGGGRERKRWEEKSLKGMGSNV